MAEIGMDSEIFEQFTEQLWRYVRERLIPAEEAIIESNEIPEDILGEMREMGLFGLSMPVEYGGAGMSVSQYVETIRIISYALPAYRSIISIGTGSLRVTLLPRRRSSATRVRRTWRS